MTLGPKSSKEVFTILPINTWTEVISLSSTPNNNDVYIVTTEGKMNKRLNDMNVISNLSYNLDKVQDFKEAEIVAIEIDGKWYRGKLLSYNELQSDDTRIELIDIGSIHQTKLKNLLVLPYYLKYEPLVLPIKFKNFIPKTKKFTIKPLLIENTLHKGFVLVDVNFSNNIESDDFKNEIEQLDSKEILLVNDSVVINTKITSNGSNTDLLSVNSLNDSSIVTIQNKTNSYTNISSSFHDSNTTAVQNKTNGHCTDALSSYLSNSMRRNSFLISPKHYDLPLKNKDYCLVTYFEDFSCIYVCKAIKKDTEYEVYNFDILTKTADKNEDTILKYNPIVGDIVRVYSSQHQDLLRAKILRNNNNGSYNIFNIDYGNTETVLSDVIFELDDELKKQSGLAVKIGIVIDFKHIQQYFEDIKNMFNCFVNNQKPFVIEFDGISKYCLENVKLKDIENWSYINSSYIMDYLQINSEPKDITQIKKSATLNIDYNIHQLNTLKNNDIVYLKHFENMANIYIVKDVVLFNEMMILINSVQCFNPEKKINVGDIVKVVNENIYRAKIMKVDGNLISVKNIDFGYHDVVRQDSLYHLTDNLKKVPGLAIKVGIKNPFIKKTKELINYISDIEQIPLYLEFDESNPNKYQEIILKRKDNLKNIFDEFLKTINYSFSLNDALNSSDNNRKIIPKQLSTDDYQSIILKNGDYCVVSYFKDFNNIYLCKAIKDSTNNSYKMHNMAIILETMGSIDCKTKTDPVIGDIVNVFSPLYQSFYRAKIIRIVDNTDFHVFYIDFGNTEVVHLSDVFELSDTLKKETKLPLRVSIKVPPNAKKTDEIDILFNDLIDNNIVLCVEYNEKSKNGLENVCLRRLETGNSVNDEILKLLPVEKIVVRNFDTCILTYFENVKCIYISNAQDLKNIENNIKNIAVHKIKTNSEIDDIVLVFSPSFQGYYRAKIMDVVDNTDFHVNYIDFGNTEIVKFNNIFELPDNLKNKPGVAIKIGLNIQYNLKGNDKVADMFLKLALDEDLLSIEFDESSGKGLENCILKVISNGLNINDEVLKLLNQSPMPSEKCNVNYVELKTDKHIKSTNSSNFINNENESVPLKNGEIVYLKYLDDSTCVFVSRASKDHQDKFEYVLHKTAKDTSRTKKINIKVGDIVKTMFKEVMFRAKILKKVDEHHYHISFIDFGNEEIVHINNIYELSNELKKISSSCVKVGLKGSPKIEKSEIVSRYIDSLETVPLYVEYDEDNPNGLKEISLKIKENNCDIFNELLKVTSKSSNIKEKCLQKLVIEYENVLENSRKSEIISSIELKNGDTVFCSHFEDFNHVYLCKSSKHASSENNDVIIDFSKVTDITIKKNPTNGDEVRVKFEERIFRAVVLGKSREKYSVLLVDIGKKINVYSDDIFESSNDLKIIPSLAIKVGLEGTSDFKVTTVVKDYFHHLWYSEPIPLILVYDESNPNYLNKVSLKKQCDGRNIIEDLLKLYNSFNDVPDNTSIIRYPKVGGSIVPKQIVNGDHVELLNANNVECIQIRQVNLYEEFKSVLDQLKTEKRENLKLAIPKIGDIVAVYSSKYNGFLRGKIIGPTIDDITQFKCVLIDFGFIEAISSKNIYMLPKCFFLCKVPKMVYRVSLAGVNKIVNSKISSYLVSSIGKIFIIEFDKNADYWYKQVVLKELKSGVVMNEEIQHLCSINSPVSQQRRLERKIIMPEKKESELDKSSHPIKSGSFVFITHFENFNSIFLRDASYEVIDNFNTLNKQILKYYRKDYNCVAISIEQIKIGDKVCVRSLLNNVMYSRAIITNKIDNEYAVFYFDYGNEELVSSDDIFKLSEELEKVQHFAVKVQIQNVPPLTKTNESEIKKYFKKKFIVPNTTLRIEFNELNSKGLDDVKLVTEFYNKNIIDEMQELLCPTQLDIKTAGKNQHFQ